MSTYREGKTTTHVSGQVRILSGLNGIEKKGLILYPTSVQVEFSQDVFQVDVQNQSASDSIYISRTGGDATADQLCFKLDAGQTVSWEAKHVLGSSISLIASASGIPVMIEGLY